MHTLALSIRQPWAWLITHGYKNLENRTWYTAVRGPILIHAGKAFHQHGYIWVRETFPDIPLPLVSAFERGGVVGKANLVGVTTSSSSPWFEGPFAFELAHAAPIPFLPFPGKLGFFAGPHESLAGGGVRPK